jgi:hypothetical protein
MGRWPGTGLLLMADMKNQRLASTDPALRGQYIYQADDSLLRLEDSLLQSQRGSDGLRTDQVPTYRFEANLLVCPFVPPRSRYGA